MSVARITLARSNHRYKVRTLVLPCLDVCGKKSNPLSSMLLEPEHPWHSSRAVRTKLVETDQSHLQRALRGKAIGTQERELRPRPASGDSEVSLSKS